MVLKSASLMLLGATALAPEIGTCYSPPAILFKIARREGFFAGGKLTQMNNPGALKFRGQAGAKMGINGYAEFADPAQGWAALDRDVQAKRRRGIDLAVAWAWIK